MLDGKTANLSAGKSPLAAKVPTGTIVLLRTTGLKDAPAAKCHPAIQVIDSFSYKKGEHEGHWFWDLKVTADSNSAAQNVALLFKGFKGWLLLHAHKAPWFIDLLDKAKLNVEGNSVDASFNQPVATVTSVMPKIVQSIHEHLKMFATMRHGHFEKTMEWKHSIPKKSATAPAKERTRSSRADQSKRLSLATASSGESRRHLRNFTPSDRTSKGRRPRRSDSSPWVGTPRQSP